MSRLPGHRIAASEWAPDGRRSSHAYPQVARVPQHALGRGRRSPRFQANVRVTDTRPLWRDAAVSPGNFGYHWNHNSESQYLNGSAMGQKDAGAAGSLSLALMPERNPPA